MARNGSGTYSLPAGNPVVTGTTISSTWANNTLSDIATALTQSLSQDGQTPVTANLPMAGFKFTGLGAGTSAGDSVRYEQFASPPAIGGTAAAAGSFTTLAASSTVSGAGFSTYLASPPAIGGTAPAAGHFTTLSASGQVTSTVATGTAPLVIASTTKVTNLYVDRAALADAATTATTATNVSGTVAVANGGTGQTTVAAALLAFHPIQLQTSVTLSGTSYTITGIPSGVRRIVFNVSGLASSGGSNILFQIGSGSVTSTGYYATSYSPSSGTSSTTSGFLQLSLSNSWYGSYILEAIDSTAWTFQGNTVTTAGGTFNGGFINLAGAVDRFNITTANGTDTLSGTASISWEY